MASSLKERFETCMSVLSSVENVDELMKPCNLPGRLRADYLAFRRLVIIEQKSLDHDVDNKVQVFLDDLVREHGPIEPAQVSLAGIIDVVAQLPRGNLFKPRLRAILTQRVDDVLAKADKQTRDTRRTFLLEEAIGVVVVLNEHATLIEPDYFVDKAWDMLRKCQPTGELRYPENHVAILISEAHRVVPPDGREMVPVETVFSDLGAKNALAHAFVEVFREQWAEFNNASTYEWPGPVRDVRTYYPAKLFKAEPASVDE